jgi:SecD/SecF fusion protein
MRNKGAIVTLAIALTLVCLYQLSFTWKATSIRKDLDRIAKNDPIKKDYLTDSLKGIQVYNLLIKNFTFKEVQERELNFGLDLKGGMNVILEVSTLDVIKALSNNSKDSTFNLALKQASVRRDKNEGNFLTLFGEEFSKIDPNARLSAIFNSSDLRDKINYNTTNEEVLKVVGKEAQGAIDNAFNIITTRIDQFGVSQPNIQKLESGDRILVELPGVKDKERVRKLLQGTANLEFWETYENAQIIESLNKANEIIYNYEKTQKDLKKDSLHVMSTIATAADTTTAGKKEGSELSLLEQIKSDTSKGQELNAAEGENKYPLFSILMPLIDRETGQPYPGSIIGRAHYKDTTKVNFYLRIAKERNILPRDAKFFWSALPIRDPQTHKSSEIYELYAIKVTSRNGKAPLDGAAIVTAAQEFDQQQGNAYVLMNMNGEGAKKWARITKENLGKVICVVLDDKVFSGPTVQSEITGGSSQITGNFTINEAQDLANLLKSGTLPAPARIIQEDVVGPTLGSESINAGLKSFFLAFLGVLLYMWLYYGRAGNVANVALFLNVVFLFGVFASMGLVLTLPGIAGIVLTLAMAVDGNVIIYERMREETRAGKSPRMVVKDGFWHAYSAIIDGHVTTILTGVVLFLFGTGTVKGFAVSLIVGLLLSLFSSIFIARLCFEWMLDRNIKITLGNKYTLNTFSKANIDFIGLRKIMYVFSASIMVIGVISLFVRGLDPSIDFKGGRTYIVNFDKPVTTAEVRTSLTKSFGSAPEVKTIGNESRVKITTAYLIDDRSAKTDSIVEHKLYEGAISHFTNPVTYDEFSGHTDKKNLGVLSSAKVDPAISNELIYKAFMAVFFGLIIIFVYIAIRFKNWKYGLGGVVSLFHDSMVVVTMFTLFWGRLPFSLEIDQSFIAAILTVIGYSIMDSVIIFDRIREYKKLYPQRPLDEIMNIGINHTLGRTINTSGITLVTLLVIFIFGGDILRGFIFALLVGVIIGTYSSVFNATPIAYDVIMATEKKKKK